MTLLYSSPIPVTEEVLLTPSGEISYTLRRSFRRRTIAISIDENGLLKAYAPARCQLRLIESFLKSKSEWIREKQQIAFKNSIKYEPKKYVQGENFLFLGKSYPIVFKEGQKKRVSIDFTGHTWLINVPLEMPHERKVERIRSSFIRWYRKQAEEVVASRIFNYARILRLEPKRIAVRQQKTMWGCCDPVKQTIHINWYLILAPLRVIDYVVVHELCHLKHANHSKRFWSLVEKYMPDYKTQRLWLKEHGREMSRL